MIQQRKKISNRKQEEDLRGTRGTRRAAKLPSGGELLSWQQPEMMKLGTSFESGPTTGSWKRHQCCCRNGEKVPAAPPSVLSGFFKKYIAVFGQILCYSSKGKNTHKVFLAHKKGPNEEDGSFSSESRVEPEDIRVQRKDKYASVLGRSSLKAA